MKILFITQYYKPEPVAPSLRVPSFVEALAQRGHFVTVICNFPQHPTGILAKKDKWRFFRVEQEGNVRIIRAFVIPFKNKSFIKRTITYTSFAISSFIIGLVIKRNNIIQSESHSPFSVYSAMLLSIIKRSTFVLDIQDLFTESAEEMEYINNKFLIKTSYLLDYLIYQKAEIIFAVTEGITNIVNNKIKTKKTCLVYNGSDDKMINWNGDIKTIRKSMGWSDKTIIIYAGNMGLAQFLEPLICEISKVSESDLHFVFIGDGACKDQIVDRSKKLNIQNISFISPLSREKIIPLTHASDIAIVALKEIDFFKGAIPTKFYDSMAAGKPVITNVEGELKQIMDEYSSGIYFSNKNSGSFGNAVRKLAYNKELRKQMGQNGKKAVRNNFLRSDLAKKVVECLENIEENSKQSAKRVN